MNEDPRYSMQPSIDLNFANALQDPWSGSVNIYLANKTAMYIDVITNLQVHRTAIDEAANIGTPQMASIKLTKLAAQHLLDALMQAGVKPSDAVEGSGQITALKDHLADMRRLAFLVIEGEAKHDA